MVNLCHVMSVSPGSWFFRERLETEIVSEHPACEDVQTKPLPRTRAVVMGLLERLNLLLQVTIAPDSSTLVRSTSVLPEPQKTSESDSFD